MAVHRKQAGRVGFVELDNPPVNAMGQAVRAGLLEAVEWAEAEGLERVIVSGAGRVFAAGGDAREFDLPPIEPHLTEVLSRIEASSVPWIAAAHGAALGGGLELMLVCRARIAAPDTSLGLPEVNLGVVPGAGGTQRLPRLAGTATALDMIPTGRSLSAVRAKEIGLIDRIADDPVAAAEAVEAGWLAERVRIGELSVQPADEEAVETARRTARKKRRGEEAPLRAIALIEDAQRLPLSEGLARERAAFLELRGSGQARALRHLFFTERAARPPAWLKDTPVPAHESAAVVGGGTMGAGIAYALLLAGLTVTVIERDAESAERAGAAIGALIETGVKRGALSREKADGLRARLTTTDDYGTAASAGIAIEAAFEDMAVKKTVLAALERALPENAILATNTSYLDIDEMAAGLGDPSRLVGLHFFAPAHIMKLLEIVRGRATSDAALALGFALAKRLRKVPVLAGVCDGFIGNRILARYREAADTLVMDGAMPWAVDEAMVGFGYAMGLYETQDLSGLDIAHAARRRRDATRDPNRRYIPIGDRMVEAGRLGRKTGAGWYRYPEGGAKEIDPAVEALVLEEARRAGVSRRDFSADDIRHRLLHAMINEAADILAEGIAASAADIDLVTVHGYGFPRWRGGLMHFADTLGPKAVLDALRELSRDDALVWKPSPLIADCAAENIAFADWRR